MNDGVVKNLERGRDRIAKGWCVHRTKIDDQDGPRYCAIGALMDSGTWDEVGEYFKPSISILHRILDHKAKRDSYPLRLSVSH